MSIEAISWALREAPNVPASCVGVLIGLADHADKRGRAAYPSVATLAGYARKRSRQVQRDLDQLRAGGVIDYGDPAVSAHLRYDKRPQVYDLAMAQGQYRPSEKGTRDVTGDTPQPPEQTERGDTDDVPQTGSGVSCETERGVTHDRAGCHTRHPNRPEPSGNRPSTPRARGIDAATLNETAARPDAWQLVADWHNNQPATYRTAVRRQLTKQANDILNDHGQADIVRAALDMWGNRPDARPGLLPYLYDDALKQATGTPQARGDKVSGWLDVDNPDNGAQPKSARGDKVNGWLNLDTDDTPPTLTAIEGGRDTA